MDISLRDFQFICVFLFYSAETDGISIYKTGACFVDAGAFVFEWLIHE